MLKNLKYFVAVALVAFGYTHEANALFDCTAEKAAKGQNYEKCLGSVETAGKNPNYTTVFYATHCTRPGKDRSLVFAPRKGMGDACTNAANPKNQVSSKR